LKSTHHTLLESAATQIKTAAGAEVEAESKMAIAAVQAESNMAIAAVEAKSKMAIAAVEAESNMAIAAAHALYLSEARAAADARSDAVSKAADLDLALSAAETLQQRLLEMQGRLQDSEARVRQMEQGGKINTMSRSPSTEPLRLEISPSALVGCKFTLHGFCFVLVVRVIHVSINDRRAMQLLFRVTKFFLGPA
jgi:hypothetical protein